MLVCTCRSCFWFPLYFVGYYDCTQDVRFKLFDRCAEYMSHTGMMELHTFWCGSSTGPELGTNAYTPKHISTGMSSLMDWLAEWWLMWHKCWQ